MSLKETLQNIAWITGIIAAIVAVINGIDTFCTKHELLRRKTRRTKQNRSAK
jgi:hypothetical protein